MITLQTRNPISPQARPTPNSITKRSYHPSILIAFHLNFLPEKLSAALPRSTRSDWMQKEQQLQFGYDWFMDNKDRFATLQCVAANEHLLKVNKALIKVIALIKFICINKQRLKDNIGSASEVVLSHIEKLKPIFGLQKCLRMLRLDYSIYRRWRLKKGCMVSLFNSCVVRHPNQLLKEEVALIKEYNQKTEYALWPKISIYHQMRRDGMLNCCRNTYYKVINILGLKKTLPANRSKKHIIGRRTDAPLKLIHIDITQFKCADGTKAFIYVVKDNFSRACLHVAVAGKVSAAITEQCLNQVLLKYKQLIKSPLEIMSDGGSENSTIKNWIKGTVIPLSLKHITAMVDVEFSNSMVEAMHYDLKYYGLYHLHITNTGELKPIVENLLYNQYNHRPNHVLGGLTPNEVLYGMTIDDVFANVKYKITKEKRIMENKKAKCCQYSF